MHILTTSKLRIVVLALALAFVAGAGLDRLPARGQTGVPSNAGTPSLQALRDSIKNYNDEILLLQHFLEASTVDAKLLQHTNVKAWRLNNPALRDSLFFALMEVDSSLQSEAGTDAEVLATEGDDIIEVRFGTAVFKGLTLRQALSKSTDKLLYRKIAESYRYSKDIELRDPAFRLPTLFEPELVSADRLQHDFSSLPLTSNPHPVRARVEASAFGISFRTSPIWGGEIRIGNDEIGYPFWSSGKMAFMASYDDKVRFGFELPFQPGRNSSEFFPPFVIRGRRLNGTRGFVGEADFGSLGGYLSVTRFTDADNVALTDPDHFAYIIGIVNAYYSFGLAVAPTNLVRVKIGAGLHRIEEASIQRRPLNPAGTDFEEVILRGGQRNYISPYLKFEYLNRESTHKFRVSLQLYDLTLMFAGSVELFPNLLFLDGKYVWPVGPDIKTWQNPDFFIVSPRVQVSF